MTARSFNLIIMNLRHLKLKVIERKWRRGLKKRNRKSWSRNNSVRIFLKKSTVTPTVQNDVASHSANNSTNYELSTSASSSSSSSSCPPLSFMNSSDSANNNNNNNDISYEFKITQTHGIPSTPISLSSLSSHQNRSNSNLGDSDQDFLNNLLGSMKSMEPNAQVEIWKSMIDKHPFNWKQLQSIKTAIDDRIQIDIISNVPYEIALYIMSFLDPKDLCQAAQTCRSWRTVCEDNRLWREKYKEDGLLDDYNTIDTLIKNRIAKKHIRQEDLVKSLKDDLTLTKSRHKSAYLKHISVLRNWETRDIKISEPFIASNENNNDQNDMIFENQNVYHADNNDDNNDNINNDYLINHNPGNINNNELNSTDNTSSSRYLMQLRCHEESVITCLQYNSKTETIVSGSDDHTLKVWCGETGKCITILEGHTGGVWSSQLSPDDIVVSGSTDRTLKVWKARTGQLLHTLHGHTSTVRCLALDGNRVVSGSRDTTMRLWDIEEGRCLHVFTGHTAAVRCVEFKNNIIVSGAYDHLVMVWDANTGLCRHALERHYSRIYSLQFDGETIASGSLDSTICIWDAATGAMRHQLEGHQSLTSKMQLKGNLLVSANADSYCKVWDINTGQCLQTLGGNYKHTSAITSVYFNNRHVVTSSDDGTVKLWDIKTGLFIRNLVELPTATKGGVVWRIRASITKLICAVGSRSQTEDTHLLVLNFDD